MTAPTTGIVRIIRARAAVVVLLSIASGLATAEPTVLITGSSRGIGLELARQYAERDWNVIATCRTPATAAQLKTIDAAHDNLVIEELDVTDFEEVDALAGSIAMMKNTINVIRAIDSTNRMTG